MNWPFHIDLSILPILAQTATPTKTPVPVPTTNDLELLKAQIEFLKTANSNLADNFARYVDMLKGILAIVVALAVAIAGSSFWEFRKTLRTINQQVEQRISQQLDAKVAEVVQTQVNQLRQVLAKESVLGRVAIDYVTPIPIPAPMPTGLTFLQKVLQRRGFKQIQTKFVPELLSAEATRQLPLFSGDVVVLDLHHGELTDNQVEQVINNIATRVPFQQSTLVVYLVGRRSQALNELPQQGHYSVPANSPLSLVGRVVEAAYVADAIKR